MSRVPNLDRDRVDSLLQYVLAVAACEDEFRDRELGPIHFIKYTYIADLAHAERHQGETFTGAPWKFHHFGPWSAEVFERIEPALAQVGAESRRISSKYADDFVRYRLGRADAERIRATLEASLPLTIQARLAAAIHECGSDTASLLRAVYGSRPMVTAAPGENLDFATVVRETRVQYGVEETALTARARRERKRRVAEISAEVQKRLAMRLARGAQVDPSPRYDDVFREGVDWLDRLAGEDVPSVSGELAIGDDVWRSDTRREPDVP